MPAQVVAVVGGAGGTGASTLAVLLARRRAARGRVVLVDLDGGACGLEVLLGIESRPGVRWADLATVHGSLAPHDLVDVLPRWEGVEVLSTDRRTPGVAGATRETVLDAVVAGTGTVVLDLSARSLVREDGLADLVGGSDAAVLVTSQDVRGVAAGLAVRPALPTTAGLVLRRRRGRVAPVEAAHALVLPLLGLIPGDRSLAGATERGLGPHPWPWGRLRRVVAHVDRNLNDHHEVLPR
jgi:secretion/DNA translocation related CpaE-like protein